MVLFFSRVSTVFTLSNFEYLPENENAAFPKWHHYFVVACLSVR